MWMNGQEGEGKERKTNKTINGREAIHQKKQTCILLRSRTFDSSFFFSFVFYFLLFEVPFVFVCLLWKERRTSNLVFFFLFTLQTEIFCPCVKPSNVYGKGEREYFFFSYFFFYDWQDVYKDAYTFGSVLGSDPFSLICWRRRGREKKKRKKRTASSSRFNVFVRQDRQTIGKSGDTPIHTQKKRRTPSFVCDHPFFLKTE